MILDTFVSLIYNAALLLSLSIVYDIIAAQESKVSRLTQVYTGLIIGVIALAIMINPWIMQPGIVFDTRTILYSLGAMFFGPIAAIVSSLFGIAYRIWMGGAGVYSGVATIISAVVWGLIWRRIHKYRTHPYSFGEFYQLGILNHISMILLMFLMPRELQWDVINTISLPVLIIYPLATVILGQIIVRRIERMQEKKALKRSEKKYRLLAETTKDMILLHDCEGNMLYANKMALHFWGLAALEERDININQFVLAEYMPELKRHVQQLLDGSSSLQVYQVQVLDGKGRHRIVEICSTLLEDEEEGYNILSAARDITDRKFTEEQKENYFKRLEILRDLDAVVLETLSFKKTCDAVAEKLQGLIPFSVLMVNEIQGEQIKILALNKPEQRHRYLNTRDGIPYSHEFVEDLRHKRNIVVSDTADYALGKGMSVQAALIKEGMRSFMYNAMIVQDEMVGFLWFCSDQKEAFGLEQIEIGQEVANQLAIILHHLDLIDKIKDHAQRMETQVEERTQQLQQANQELESFAYSVAHDLRAPLQIISGYSDILETDFAAELRMEAREILETIRTTALRMDKIIRGLYKLFGLNQQEIKKEQLHMQKIIEAQLQMVPDDFEVTMDTILDCQGDATLIEQVWQNLLENAVKFTIPAPQHKIHIGCERSADQVIYSIQDSGVGFDPEQAESIFAPFKRLHYKNEFTGSGIGLALIKRIIQHHGGRVWAESEPNQGSTFYFSMPIEPASEQEANSDDQ